jgi:hypothetical protein
MKLFLVCAAAFSLSLAFTSRAADKPDAPPKAALEAIDAGDLLKHIKVLASDEFEGRAPGSKGEELTVKYITEQFRAVGLKPGNPNGSYTQEVPMAGVTSKPTLTIGVGSETLYPEFLRDMSRSPRDWSQRSASLIQRSFSSATESSRRNTGGTTTRTSTFAARRS